MAVRPRALAVNLLVFFLTQLRTSQAVGCSEVGTNGEECIHGISEIVGPEARLFVEA